MFKFLDNLNVDQTIIVCDNKINMLIQEYYQNKLIPIKIMDYNTFIDYYLGVIDEDVYISLIKQNYPYELSKILVSHFLPYYYLNITDKRLDNVKEIILKHFKVNKYIQTTLKSKDIIFINPDLTNDLIITALQISESKIIVKEINQNNHPNIRLIKESNIDNEVDVMFNILTKDLVTNNEDIYLYLTNNDYLPIVLAKLNLFKLKYVDDISTSLMDLSIGKELVNYLDKHYTKRDDIYTLFNEGVNYLKDHYLINEDNLEKIYKVLSKFTKYLITDYKIIKDVLVDNLRQIKIVNKVIKTNLKLITKLPTSLNNKIIYILGANQNSFPLLVKNRDYFTDKLRIEYKLPTSISKNQFNQERLVNILNSTKYAYISYNTSNEKIRSSILDQITYQDELNSINNIVSKEVDEVLYSKALDKYYIYKELSKELEELYNQEVKSKYSSYDNQFKGNIKIKEDVTLSATSLKEYYECNYKYYLDRILRISNPSDKSIALIGDYFHLMLKKLFKEEITISSLKEETLKYIEDSLYLVNDKITEYYYLKYSKYVEQAYLYINNIYHLGDIYKIEYEKELNSLLNTVVDEVTYLDKVKGVVDKYFVYKIGEAYQVLIVDYKTSDTKTNLDLLPYGLDVQLPIYFYLLSLDDLHYELVGSFLQQVMPKNLYSMKKDKSIEDQYIKDILYRGYIVSENSDKVLVKNKSKTITLEETKTIIKQVDELLKKAFINIHNGSFNINPKLVNNGKINSCTYCPYAAICYKRVTDYVVINTKEEGGEENE